MNLRDATARDAAQIAEIWNGVIRDSDATFTSDEKPISGIAELIENAEVFLVSEEVDSVTGFCTMAAFRSGPGYAGCREITLHLSTNTRRKGIGRALLTALETRAKAMRLHTLIAGISGANPTALAFHKAMGFREVGRLPEVGEKFGQRFDLVLMLKKL